MNSTWHAFLGAAGARFENEQVADFGDAAGELAAARDGTVLVPLTHLGVIACDGEDAQSFLHNQLTSDVNHLEAGHAQHAAWCTAKGRMQASFVAWRSGSDFRLLLAADLLAATVKRLSLFVLRARVKISDRSDALVLLGVAGAGTGAALAAAGLPQPPAPMTTAGFDGGCVLRLDAARAVIAVEAEHAAEIWRGLTPHAHKAGTPAWHWLDIRAGLPLVTAATKEEFVPQMANFERLGGVSFHKGCYPGQEVIARTQYLGKVKRHLYRVRAAVPLVPGTPVYSPETPDQASGMIANGAPSPGGGYEALAVLMESAVLAGVRLGAPDGAELDCAPVAG